MNFLCFSLTQGGKIAIMPQEKGVVGAIFAGSGQHSEVFSSGLILNDKT